MKIEFKEPSSLGMKIAFRGPVPKRYTAGGGVGLLPCEVPTILNCREDVVPLKRGAETVTHIYTVTINFSPALVDGARKLSATLRKRLDDMYRSAR
jgi:hypothetical protein